MAKRRSKTSRIFTVVLILLLLCGAIAGFAVLLKNNIEDLPESVFYVQIDEKKIFTNASG